VSAFFAKFQKYLTKPNYDYAFKVKSRFPFNPFKTVLDHFLNWHHKLPTKYFN